MIDTEQVTGWFKAYAPALVLYARQWLERSAAEDVVQKAFVRLMAQSSAPGQVKAWLFRAVRNGAISAWRSRRRRERHERAVETASPWFQTRDADPIDADRATQVLRSLPAEWREIVVLRIWGGLTWPEVADTIGLPTSTVFHRYQEALRMIRGAMQLPCPTKHP